MIKMTVTGINEKNFPKIPPFPLSLSLTQNTPNPFCNQTRISYFLSKETEISLKVFNTAEEVVSSLVNNRQKSGYYNVIWNGCDSKGNKLPKGVYFYRLEAEGFIVTKKMVKTE